MSFRNYSLPARWALPLMAPLCLVAKDESAGSGQSDPTWESLSAETTEMLQWSEDPLAEALPPPPPWTFSASLAAGHGYSDNFLKTRPSAASSYLHLSGDLYLTRLGETQSFTALVFGEYHAYLQAENGADNESILFGLFLWEWFARGGGLHGIEADVFYGDQIYDAALLDLQEPSGGRLRQLRPGLRAFTEWPLGGTDVLRWEAGVRHTWYGDPEEDSTRPDLRLEWTRSVTPRLELTSAIEGAVEIYDHRRAREASGGLPENADTLQLKVLSLEQEIDWKEFPFPFLDLRAKAGLRHESDRRGDYDGNRTWWASLSLDIRIKEVEMDFRGRWQRRTYSDRQVGFLDESTLHQRYRGLEWELTVPLGRRWELLLHGSSSEFTSRDATSNYSENRAQGALRWTW
jgi:hypothetical protein